MQRLKQSNGILYTVPIKEDKTEAKTEPKKEQAPTEEAKKPAAPEESKGSKEAAPALPDELPDVPEAESGPN